MPVVDLPASSLNPDSVIVSRCRSPYHTLSSEPLGTQKRIAESPPPPPASPISSDAKPMAPRLMAVITPAALLNE